MKVRILHHDNDIKIMRENIADLCVVFPAGFDDKDVDDILIYRDFKTEGCTVLDYAKSHDTTSSKISKSLNNARFKLCSCVFDYYANNRDPFLFNFAFVNEILGLRDLEISKAIVNDLRTFCIEKSLGICEDNKGFAPISLFDEVK